jgi:outer membrane protein
MKLIVFIVCLFASVFSINTVNIALVFDGDPVYDHGFYEMIEREIVDLLSDEFTVEFTEFADNWSLESAKMTLERALRSDEITIVVTLGILSSYAALELSSPRKPVVVGFDANLFIDETPLPKSSRIAYFKGKKHLLTELRLFSDITNASSIAVIGDASLIDFSLIRNQINIAIEDLGKEVVMIPVTDDPSIALSQLKKLKPGGVLLLPLPRMEPSSLIQGINALKIPSFSFGGEDLVEMGVLMTTTPNSEFIRIGRRIALNIQDYLLNGHFEPADFAFFRTEQVIINATTAEEIGVDLPWRVTAEAKMIAPVIPSSIEQFTLFFATERAVKQNLDLISERYVVKSGREEVMKTLSALLPKVNTNAKARMVNPNLARVANGLEPQRVVRGSVDLSQMIYREDLVSGYSIEKREQEARKFDKASVQLDVIYNTTIAYLLVLRIEADKQIAQENLELTQANLKRAHELVDTGQARLSEVYRWESELATNRETLVNIQAELDNIKTEFNRLLNRPLTDAVYLSNLSPVDSNLLLGLGTLSNLVDSPGTFERYKLFLTSLAKRTSPEIKAYEERVLAQYRNVVAKKRAYYLPDFALFGTLNRDFWMSGLGTQTPNDGSNKKPFGELGINVTYPISTGGLRGAEKRQSIYELDKLRTDMLSTTQKIEERVVKAIDNMKSSYDGIFLAKQSAIAGEKNLVIVTNSYARGIVSIVDLIDAQNTAIVAKQSYSNALYDYLIDYMEMERSLGQFDHYLDEEQRHVLQENLKEALK